jgi:hypothetical protein
MAKNRPIKFRILEIYSDGKDHWNSDVVKQLQTEYGMKSNYGRDSINFDIIELAAGGMLKEIDVSQDIEGKYKHGALLHKYVITAYGKTKANESCFAHV